MNKRIHAAYVPGEQKHGGQNAGLAKTISRIRLQLQLFLAENTGGSDTLVAALLHDTVEDTDLTLDEIQSQFGPTVAHLIEG